MKDELYYDDQTLVRAHHALMGEAGLSAQDADNAITALLNANILLRDRYEGGKA